MHITHHRGVGDRRTVDRLWSLYESSFTPTSAQAASKEMLFRHEFDEMLANETNRLWVLHHDDQPVGMCMVATDISLSRYLSRRFFEEHYPDHARTGRVHLIAFLTVHPDYVGQGSIIRLGRAVLEVETAEESLLVFDTPQVHQPHEAGGFAEMMSRLSKMVGSSARAQQVEVQRYFVIDFAASAANAPSVARPVVDRRASVGLREAV
jgi:GNAT superfamily N-acetyltransferase